MIKLFRRIRQNLLTENKFNKYLLYAIGEIILVVIGILIALQINNWNELEKDKKYLGTIYQTIKTDLQNDIIEGKTILKSYQKLEQYYPKIRSGNLTEDDYLACNCGEYFVGFSDLYINTRGYELLKQTNNELVRNATLPEDISNFYTKYLYALGITVQDMNTLNTSLIDKWSEKEWWADFVYSIDDQGFKNYILNDKKARNEYAISNRLLNGYIREIKEFVKEAEVLIVEIDQHN